MTGSGSLEGQEESDSGVGTCTGQTDTGRWLERYLCALFARWFTCVVLLDLRRLFIARDPASSCGTQRPAQPRCWERREQVGTHPKRALLEVPAPT